MLHEVLVPGMPIGSAGEIPGIPPPGNSSTACSTGIRNAVGGIRRNSRLNLTLNLLSINSSKTKYLLICNRQQRSKVTDSSLSFNNTTPTPVSSARYPGVVLNSDLSFNQHVSNVCRSFFYHI